MAVVGFFMIKNIHSQLISLRNSKLLAPSKEVKYLYKKIKDSNISVIMYKSFTKGKNPCIVDLYIPAPYKICIDVNSNTEIDKQKYLTEQRGFSYIEIHPNKITEFNPTTLLPVNHKHTLKDKTFGKVGAKSLTNRISLNTMNKAKAYLKHKYGISDINKKNLIYRKLAEIENIEVNNKDLEYCVYEFINSKSVNNVIKSYRKHKKVYKVKSKTFYDSEQWQELRTKVLKHYGLSCMKCKATKTELHVDHIKPRSKYPTLELEFSNMQVLCRKCNMDKSNTDETDYRN